MVLVLPSYRLGPFGWFNTGAEGNAGGWDVVEALRFVRANVAGFGGDPAKVTAVGHGAGAVLASMLTLSPYGQGEATHLPSFGSLKGRALGRAGPGGGLPHERDDAPAPSGHPRLPLH